MSATYMRSLNTRDSSLRHIYRQSMGKSGQCLYEHAVPTTWQVSKNAKCLTNIADEATRLIRERNYVLPKLMMITLISATFTVSGKGTMLNICTSVPSTRHGNHAQVRNVCIFNITVTGTRILLYVPLLRPTAIYLA
jgi:hypothetical protein